MENAKRSLGLTKQRSAVLQVISEADDHLTANEILDRARKVLQGISFATVYNSLRYLRDEGLIGEIQFGSGVTRYDRRITRHDHAVCNQCGKLVDIDLPVSDDIVKKAARLSRFKPECIELVLRGTCPDCRKK